MLLVVFGAGASYDSVPTRPVGTAARAGDPVDERRIAHRPPLADELFTSTLIFEEVQRQFEPLREVVARLQYRPKGESVEDVLARMQEESHGYAYRRRHLMAVRYYIHEVMRRSEEHWVYNDPLGTNHQHLYDQIELCRAGRGPQPLFVTFNYDRLIEYALIPRGVVYNSMDDYIREDAPRLFKLHGSIDWRRAFQTKPDVLFGSHPSVPSFVIRNAEQEAPLGAIQKENDLRSQHHGGFPLIPALALPYRGKAFECPESHLTELRRLLPHVRGMISIGWRGNEEHFLKELGLIPPATVMVHAVSGNVNASEATIQSLARLGFSPSSRPLPFGGGFSDYVRSNEMKQMLLQTLAPDAAA